MTTLAQDCGKDIKKFCKGLNLGNNQIRECLEGNQAEVSPTCTSTSRAVTASIERRLAAQASVFEVCAGNAKQHCKGVVGEVAHSAMPGENRAHRQCNLQSGDHRRWMALKRQDRRKTCQFVQSISV